MLHINDDIIKKFLFRGYFGLEKEGLRVTGEGHPATTEHPIYVKKGMVHAKKLQNKKLRYEMEFVRYRFVQQNQ